MRLVPPPNVNTARLEAQRASDARWLVALLRWISFAFERIAPLARGIPLLREALAAAKAGAGHALRKCVHDLRFIITELAFARMRLSPYRQRETLHPGGGQSRRARRRSNFYRRATAGLFHDLHAGTLRQRTERLAAHLANLEPLIARTCKRLNAMWRFKRTARHVLIVVDDICASLALTPQAAFADTS